MPGQTSNFAIRYPCPGDPVNALDFANWAGDIESAFSQVQVVSANVLNKPRAMFRTSNAGQAIPVGVTTQITFSTTVYNEGLDTTLAGFDVVTTGNSGNYLFMAQITPIGTGTTVTSWSGTIQSGAGGNIVAGRASGTSAASTIAKPINLVGIGPMTILGGAFIQFTWTGTGGPLNVYAQFSCHFICNL